MTYQSCAVRSQYIPRSRSVCIPTAGTNTALL